MCFEKQTVLCQNKLLQLEPCVKREIHYNSDLPEEFEEETIVIENGITYREKSPFGKHYEIIHMNCRSFIKNDQDISQEKETNSCLFPGIIEFLLTIITFIEWNHFIYSE